MLWVEISKVFFYNKVGDMTLNPEIGGRLSSGEVSQWLKKQGIQPLDKSTDKISNLFKSSHPIEITTGENTKEVLYLSPTELQKLRSAVCTSSSGVDDTNFDKELIVDLMVRKIKREKASLIIDQSLKAWINDPNTKGDTEEAAKRIKIAHTGRGERKKKGDGF